MVEFGGWEMPVSYPSGTLVEHRACRNQAVAFDVSHLGTVSVTGPDAYEALQLAFTNDLAKIAPGRAQYTHLLDVEASVLDDIIVWWREDGRLDVMPNASNTARVVAALDAAGVDVADVTATRAVVAVQGPDARRLLAAISPVGAQVGRFRVTTADVASVECVVAGTGYTGEDGVEIAVPVDHANAVWDRIVEAGIVPAGLGARDTLRLEAGLPLHGHELGPGITPLQAGLDWVVGWSKPRFRGREALLAERERGPHRLLRGLLGRSRRPLRDGAVVSRDGAAVGSLTSGNFSPMIERGIGLGFLAIDVAVGEVLAVDLRGTVVEVEVVEPPFHKR